MNNWTCPKCKSDNADEQRFCGSCGSPQPAEQQSAPELQPTMMAGYVPQMPTPPLDRSAPNPVPPQNSAQPPSAPPFNPTPANQSNFQPGNQNFNSNQQNLNQNPSGFNQNQQGFNPNQQNFNANQQGFNPNQNNYQQSQPPNQQYQNAPNQPFQIGGQPAAYSPNDANKPKSKLPQFIGFTIVMCVILGGGALIWTKIVSPYLEEQAFKKTEKENQSRADSNNPAGALMPTVAVYDRGSQTYNRARIYNKMELLQASQNLPPELKEGVADVTDAAAGDYVNAANATQKIAVRVYKFNSPQKAASGCSKIGDLLQKRKEAFKEVHSYPTFDYRRPSFCSADVTVKEGGFIEIDSAYGYLIVASGGSRDAVIDAARSTKSRLYSF